MVNARRPFAGRTVAEMMEAPIEEFDAAQEVDMLRLSIAVNIRSWVEKAHNILDVNANVDRDMLGKMSGYVKRVRRYVRACPFIVSEDAEMEARAADLPTKEVVVPPKNMKRVRDESRLRKPLLCPISSSTMMGSTSFSRIAGTRLPSTSRPSRKPPHLYIWRRPRRATSAIWVDAQKAANPSACRPWSPRQTPTPRRKTSAASRISSAISRPR